MSTSTEVLGAYCLTAGAITPIYPDAPACEWCGREHRAEYRWTGSEYVELESAT